MHKLFWFLFLLATANIQAPQTPPPSKQLNELIQKAVIRLQQISEHRSLKLKSWNDSIQKLAEASRQMSAGGKPRDLIHKLQAARKDYAGNSFSYVLEAIVTDTLGPREEANELFEKFLTESRTFSEFEETFLHWFEFYSLRREVYELLKSRGVSFEGKEKEIRARIPYEAFWHYVLDPHREDWILNLFFVITILGGGALLIGAHLMGVDFLVSKAGTLLLLYVIIWIAYGLWIFDLVFGIPWGWSRHYVVPIFFAFSIVCLAVGEIYSYVAEKRRPLEEGYRRCPHCRAVIVLLSVQCSECGKEV